MRILKFLIDGQKITPDPDCDFSGIVPGTAGYLYAQFSFSDDWNGLVKAAEFKKYQTAEPYPVAIRNGMCRIPEEVLSGKGWRVRVYGKRGSIRICTAESIVRQEE